MKKTTLFIFTFLVAWNSIQAQSAGIADTSRYTLSHTHFIQSENTDLQIARNTLYESSTVPGKEKMKESVVKLQYRPIVITNKKCSPSLGIQFGKANRSPKEQMKAEVMKLHTCSIHTLTSLDKNDICPKCSRLQAIKELEKRLNIPG